MPYKDKAKHAEYARQWYKDHRALTYQRAVQWRKRKRQEKMLDGWFREICENICRGISTKTLDPDLHDKFWETLAFRVRRGLRSDGKVGEHKPAKLAEPADDVETEDEREIAIEETNLDEHQEQNVYLYAAPATNNQHSCYAMLQL
jgi:hypothetical protein